MSTKGRKQKNEKRVVLIKSSSVKMEKKLGERKLNLKESKIRRPYFFRIGLRDKILFAKHLAVMLEAGIPLRTAMETLTEQTTSKTLQYILSIAVKDLSDGQVLAFTLAKFPQVFDQFFTNLIAVGETSGTLEESLKYIAAQLEKTQDLQDKVRNALLYPAIVFLGALGVGAYLGFYMLPQLMPLFTSLNMRLPITTRILLATSVWLSHNFLWVLVGIICFVVILFLLWRIRAIKFIVHYSFIRVPILGRLFREIQIMQFSRVFGTLLLSGIKIVPALRIVANSLTNLVYQEEVNKISTIMERGETVGGELRKLKRLFSRTSANMVMIGEETGHLSESLLSLADFSEREIDSMTKNLSTMIEPFVLIIVGIIVGFVALSVITPIYQVTQSFSK